MLAPAPSSRESLSYITASCTAYLASLPGTTNISLTAPSPLTIPLTQKFESDNSVTLPTDLRDFYTGVSNGLTLRWSALSAATGILSHPHLDPARIVNKPAPATSQVAPNSPTNLTSFQVGFGHVNELTSLERVFFDRVRNPFVDYYNRVTMPPNYIPPRSTRGRVVNTVKLLDECKAFVLDNQDNNGMVVLVYNCTIPTANTEDGAQEYGVMSGTSIWFITRTNQWYYLCDDFTKYLRLMVTHLGIRGWWGLYGDTGVDQYTENIMRRFIPERLVIAKANSIKCDD